VPDDQLSLAIGREGQNARLAARLTGWRIDIRSETEFATEDRRGGEEGSDEAGDGRCHAVLATGRRCPNASLPGSRYCGLPAHQALVDYDTDDVTVLTGEGEDDELEADAGTAEPQPAEPGDAALEPAPESAEPDGVAESDEAVPSAPPAGEAEES
jgi:N utilization substance protein A